LIGLETSFVTEHEGLTDVAFGSKPVMLRTSKCCPLCPLSDRRADIPDRQVRANSCREQMQQNACGGPALFDHLISKGEQLRGNFEAERLSGGQIDDQIKLGRLQHRQVGGLLSFENAAGVTASLLERIS
jgi:hypothetical protein